MGNAKYDRLNDDEFEIVQAEQGVPNFRSPRMPVPWSFVHLAIIISYTFAYLVVINNVSRAQTPDQIYCKLVVLLRIFIRCPSIVQLKLVHHF